MTLCEKINKMVNNSFNVQLVDFVGNRPFGKRHPTSLGKKVRKKLVARWRSCLKDMGMRTVTEKAMERAIRGRSVATYVRDPATGWRGGDTAYIEIPEETALKILALGFLP